MHWRRFSTAAAALFAILLVGPAATPAAIPTITSSTITSPADPSFFVVDNEAASNTFTISGTTTGSSPGQAVDIRCYFDSGSPVPVASNVSLAPDGSFSVSNVDLGPIEDSLCRLRAVPAGSTPADVTPFTGPRVGVGSSDTSRVSGGPNANKIFDYDIYAPQLTGASEYISLDDCALASNYLFTGFTETTRTFSCAAGLAAPGATRSNLQIDGADTYGPSEATGNNQNGTGLPAMIFSYSVAAHTGDFVIHETDPLVKCVLPTYPPTTTSCASFVSTGVTDHRTITEDHDGHISWFTDVFTSTDGKAHLLDLLWQEGGQFWLSSGDSTQIEYEFPGQSGFSTHADNDTVSLPASPGTIFLRMHGAADGDTSTGRGALVYDRPVTTATFDGVIVNASEYTLHQTGMVPAGGSTRFRFAFVQDYHAANVASLAQTATTAFLNALSVSKAGNGSGTVASSVAGISCGATCSHAYPYGTSVTLTPTAATGSAFSGWSGACSGMGACTVTTDDATAVTASFSLVPETLSVGKKGDGKGTVTSAPSGISCGPSCSHDYDYGSSVTLSAKAGKGSAFGGWSGACSGRHACTLSMTAAKSVKASFLRNCVVPRLKGKSLKAAKRLLKSHDCALGKVRHAASSKVKKGLVISQKPKPGKHLKHGAKVGVVLSKGAH